MNWQVVRIILANELRMLLRYRRTVFLAVVLPLVTMPLILFTARFIGEQRQERLESMTYKYSVTGSEADRVRGLIARAKERFGALQASKDSDDALAHFKFEEVRVKQPRPALEAKELDFYLEALSGKEADAMSAEALKGEEDKPSEPGGRTRRASLGDQERLPGVPVIRIFFLADRPESALGRSNMRTLLQRERRFERNALLQRDGFAADPTKVMTTQESDVANAAQVTSSYLGRFLTVVLLMLTLSGGSIVAIDSIAGEKERGSLETLLTTAATRAEIVAAKQILILSVALFITFIQVANILVYVGLKIIDLPKDWVIEVPPATVITVLFLFIPLAAFIAAALLMISAYSKSYKEAQLYFFPLNILSWVPALAAVLPGISLRSAIVLVPIANVSVAVREVMVGKFDWPMICAVFAVMVTAAALAIRASARMLTQEKLITAGETDFADFAGGDALFQRHTLRWFAVMAAVAFAAALNLPQVSSMKGQILFNELIVFLGASLLMILRYKLNPREALALRPVKPAVWLAVLMAIPSGTLVGIGVFKLAGFIFPVPERMLEQFSRMLIPEGMPFWQLVILAAVLPGVCEEAAFRGLLLFGLHRRYRPVALAVVVGIIFGLFHVTLFRIIPTAFLGVILTAMALLTGSIFPGMAAHAGNNALALYLSTHGVSIDKLAWWVYGIGACVLALSFCVIYLNRTPYPGLKQRHGQKQG